MQPSTSNTPSTMEWGRGLYAYIKIVDAWIIISFSKKLAEGAVANPKEEHIRAQREIQARYKGATIEEFNSVVETSHEIRKNFDPDCNSFFANLNDVSPWLSSALNANVPSISMMLFDIRKKATNQTRESIIQAPEENDCQFHNRCLSNIQLLYGQQMQVFINVATTFNAEKQLRDLFHLEQIKRIVDISTYTSLPDMSTWSKDINFALNSAFLNTEAETHEGFHEAIFNKLPILERSLDFKMPIYQGWARHEYHKVAPAPGFDATKVEMSNATAHTFMAAVLFLSKESRMPLPGEGHQACLERQLMSVKNLFLKANLEIQDAKGTLAIHATNSQIFLPMFNIEVTSRNGKYEITKKDSSRDKEPGHGETGIGKETGKGEKTDKGDETSQGDTGHVKKFQGKKHTGKKGRGKGKGKK